MNVKFETDETTVDRQPGVLRKLTASSYLTSFRWIHIGPDDDVEPYGGGPEVGGGGPGAPQLSGQGHPTPTTGWAVRTTCNAPRLAHCNHAMHLALHSGILPWFALMRASHAGDARAFAMCAGSEWERRGCNATRVCPTSMAAVVP